MPKRYKPDDDTLTLRDVHVVLPGDAINSYITSSSSSTNNSNDSTLTNDVVFVEHSSSDTTSTTIATPSNEATVVKLGTGLKYSPISKHVHATCAGRLLTKRMKDSHGNTVVTYNVEPHRNHIRRYQPNVDDRIVGIVVDRCGTDDNGGDIYRIDMNASHYGVLSNLQFSGATKRNKPILLPGQVVYARILQINNENHLYDPILSCINGQYDAGIPSKDWTTKEGCYGELRGGTVCRISMQQARNILDPIAKNNIVLNELAKHKQLAFEIAIGMNGYIWINSTISEYIILILNAIQNSNVLTAEQNRAMVKNIVYIVDKQLQQRSDTL
jgi:exosome complex component RRP40